MFICDAESIDMWIGVTKLVILPVFQYYVIMTSYPYHIENKISKLISEYQLSLYAKFQLIILKID